MREIKDLRRICKLALKRKSVIVNFNGTLKTLPAAFVQNWQLRLVNRYKLYIK